MWEQAAKRGNLDSFTTDDLQETRTLLAGLGFVGGVGDKKTTRMYAMCTKLRDFCMVKCALGNRFKVWGWAPTQAVANRVVIEDTVTKARSLGVIRDMRGFNIGYKALGKSSRAKKRLDENVPCNTPKGFKGKVRSPSITNIPKWKSNLTDGDHRPQMAGRYHLHSLYL